MKFKKFYDPYAELLARLNRLRVEYLVVGMAGINYYAASAREAFATQDFDIFVNPTISNVHKALSVLTKLGYDIAVNAKRLDKAGVKDAVSHEKTIVASNPYGILFELILSVSGYTFAQMACDARVFTSGKTPIKVAQLQKLLRSKKLAGRKKDMLFLERYEILLKEQQ